MQDCRGGRRSDHCRPERTPHLYRPGSRKNLTVPLFGDSDALQLVGPARLDRIWERPIAPADSSRTGRQPRSASDRSPPARHAAATCVSRKAVRAAAPVTSAHSVPSPARTRDAALRLLLDRRLYDERRPAGGHGVMPARRQCAEDSRDVGAPGGADDPAVQLDDPKGRFDQRTDLPHDRLRIHGCKGIERTDDINRQHRHVFAFGFGVGRDEYPLPVTDRTSAPVGAAKWHGHLRPSAGSVTRRPVRAPALTGFLGRRPPFRLPDAWPAAHGHGGARATRHARAFRSGCAGGRPSRDRPRRREISAPVFELRTIGKRQILEKPATECTGDLLERVQIQRCHIRIGRNATRNGLRWRRCAA